MKQKLVNLQVRMSPAEHDRLKRLAEEHGMSVSAYVRWKLLYEKEDKK